MRVSILALFVLIVEMGHLWAQPKPIPGLLTNTCLQTTLFALGDGVIHPLKSSLRRPYTLRYLSTDGRVQTIGNNNVIAQNHITGIYHGLYIYNNHLFYLDNNGYVQQYDLVDNTLEWVRRIPDTINAEVERKARLAGSFGVALGKGSQILVSDSDKAYSVNFFDIDEEKIVGGMDWNSKTIDWLQTPEKETFRLRRGFNAERIVEKRDEEEIWHFVYSTYKHVELLTAFVENSSANTYLAIATPLALAHSINVFELYRVVSNREKVGNGGPINTFVYDFATQKVLAYYTVNGSLQSSEPEIRTAAEYAKHLGCGRITGVRHNPSARFSYLYDFENCDKNNYFRTMLGFPVLDNICRRLGIED